MIILPSGHPFSPVKNSVPDANRLLADFLPPHGVGARHPMVGEIPAESRSCGRSVEAWLPCPPAGRFGEAINPHRCRPPVGPVEYRLSAWINRAGKPISLRQEKP